MKNLKKNMNPTNFIKSMSSSPLFKNIYVLYFIFLVSILHAGWFLYYKHFKSIIIFATSCLVIYLVNKNMIIVLGISIIIVDLLYTLNKKEGFEEKDSSMNSIMKSIDNSNNSIDNSNNSIMDSIMNLSIDNSNNLLMNENMTMPIDETNVDYASQTDKETMSNYMEDKTIIQKLNPIITDSIKKMNSIYIEELNKNINALNNFKDP